MRLTSLAVFAATAVLASSAPRAVDGPPGGTNGWRITFQDDFDSFDAKKWHQGWACANGQPDTCFFHNRFGTAYAESHAQARDGRMQITASYDGNAKKYTSGAINTAGRFKQRFGYFEARIKPSSSPGSDPCFWLASLKTWPPEIDIAEFGGAHNGQVVAVPSLHVKNTPDRAVNKRKDSGSYNDDFHNYGLYWDDNQVIGYIDGVETGRIQGNVPQEELVVILSDEIRSDGGAWFGNPANGRYPHTSEIDWVRVWQRQ